MPRNGVGTVGYTESSNNTDAHYWLLFKHMGEKIRQSWYFAYFFFAILVSRSVPAWGAHLNNDVSTGSS